MLDALFEASGGAPVRVGEDLVHRWVEVLPAARRVELLVGFMSEQLPDGVFEQGIAIEIDGGVARYRDDSFETVFVWSAGQAEPERVLVARTGRRLRLLVWNVWRDAESVQALAGDAGMVVDPGDQRLVLRCNSGVGPPAFADLVAVLRWEPA